MNHSQTFNSQLPSSQIWRRWDPAGQDQPHAMVRLGEDALNGHLEGRLLRTTGVCERVESVDHHNDLPGR
jgi:hypothetical protein